MINRTAVIKSLIKNGVIKKGMTLKEVLNVLFCVDKIYKTRAKYIWTWDNIHMHFTPKRRGEQSTLLKITEDLL